MVSTIVVSSHNVHKCCFLLLLFVTVGAIFNIMSAIFIYPTVFWWWWRSPVDSSSVTSSTARSTTTSPYTPVSKMSIRIILVLTLELFHLRNKCLQLFIHVCVCLGVFFQIIDIVQISVIVLSLFICRRAIF